MDDTKLIEKQPPASSTRLEYLPYFIIKIYMECLPAPPQVTPYFEIELICDFCRPAPIKLIISNIL